MRDQIRVVIAIYPTLLRETLLQSLRQEEGIEIVGEAVNSLQTIDTISNLKPDIVLLDTSLPNMNDIKIIPAIREKSKKTKVLVFSKSRNESVIFKALKSGAKGYVSQDVSIEVLIKAIQKVYKGELWVERKLMARFFDGEVSADSQGEGTSKEPNELLTPREKEILRLLATGRRNKEIAKALFISEKTVKSHLNSIFRKIKVTRRLKAILYAINRGLT